MADKMEHDRQQALRAEADKVLLYTIQYNTIQYTLVLLYSRTSLQCIHMMIAAMLDSAANTLPLLVFKTLTHKLAMARSCLRVVVQIDRLLPLTHTPHCTAAATAVVVAYNR
jgi:hypothetical protein